jgi:iron(II)-dependent oxidoreductase
MIDPSSNLLTAKTTPEFLVACLREARERTLGLIGDLSHDQLMGPELATVNPLLWEIGHVGWFQERWCLCHLRGRTPLLAHSDELYDSIEVHHPTRWGLELLPRARVLDYAEQVLGAVEEDLLASAFDEETRELATLSLFHEDMHGEAFTLTRQTLAYPCPADDLGLVSKERGEGPLPGDVELAGGVFRPGAKPTRDFCFDNERWAHDRTIAPFRMARATVTQAEFTEFVEDHGYGRRELWSDDGWRWREEADARHPVYWRREADGRWMRRHFSEWVSLEDHKPVHHVNAFEAEAFCRWKGRRLPTEAEWEFAAGSELHPWGDDPATPDHAHLDLRCADVAEVGAYPKGDTSTGLRQLCGNVWEWTASPFEPYPGFEPGHYREFSEPWFNTCRVLRGGAFATRTRMLSNTLRNFYTPERRDLLAGFRTVAL